MQVEQVQVVVRQVHVEQVLQVEMVQLVEQEAQTKVEVEVVHIALQLLALEVAES